MSDTQRTSADGRNGPAATLTRIDHVALITLNRPHRLNAVNSALSSAVGKALQTLDDDPDLHVGVITGTGPAFCAGADLKALAAGESFKSTEHPEWGLAGLVEHRVQSPLVAAVNGIALGGGAEIALACDLAVMSEDAVFGLPEVQRGLFAGAGGLIRLPRHIPSKLAREMALTGDPIDAATALRWGLVNRVAPPGDVLPIALALAARIAGHAPLAVRATKRMLSLAEGAHTGWDANLWNEQEALIHAILASGDAREGVQAFAQRRLPAEPTRNPLSPLTVSRLHGQLGDPTTER
ncbi:enoyl-CoA hydratase [Rhodococcus sp. ACPA4]|uniref:crotonase/enoyl-CoA hydratase family protein n=1 Tax=Rhodococcus sp. ACPA4 TaxID=2028571 RepID=UPI000BB0ED58|nr:crotonase/enoyl-CoA hydratase family protein [Rhodococcus sp. ACPA4]PBC36026.1 enoyl-CoA hydratase [Rhodococcus sp. ACPA4]